MTSLLKFPDNFLWGTATCAYQIEGAVNEDGRGESIWDVFSHTPGKIHNNDNGDVACDHYHRWQEDIQLMKSLGFKSYRFSIAWPRILPEGRGKINQPGLDFYNRLIDGLLEAGIQPLATLYHWDLPTALEGAWLNRSTVDAFAEYSGLAARHFGDRVKMWFTINEPWCASHLSYTIGEQAPGLKDRSKGILAAHHVLLAHGVAVKELRKAVHNAQIGIVLNMSPIHNDPDAPISEDRVRFMDGELIRWFADPSYGRGYPKDMLEDYVRMGMLKSTEPDFIKPGDMDLIAQETDLLGINYYTRMFVSSKSEGVHSENRDVPKTDMGWELYPQGLFEILERVNRDYQPRQLMVTENGASYADGPDENGRVHDQRRIDYLQTHIYQIWLAIQAGIPVNGYLVWSLMDNFEWARGYSQRFGMIHVDYKTQKRTIKDSAQWYRDVIKRIGLSVD
ncbi:MAG TPA: GH1 family beta-glucosidase [Anaerolineaceae bacterium]|nr:GH1 family beta-glucosidase [Anaerolineaceae bacterium]